MRKGLIALTLLVVAVVFFGAGAAAGRFLLGGAGGAAQEPELKAQMPTPMPARGSGPAVYNPPTVEEAPEELREVVQRGYDILMDPQKHVPDYVGNEMKCRNCHFNAGLTEGGKNGGLTLVGTAAVYPKYRQRQEYSVDLTVRVNDCFERSQNGKPLPASSQDMTAILTYFKWISKDIPIYGDVPWLGLKLIENDHEPDPAAGQQVYSSWCQSCHGANGEGTQAAPPLWGDGAYNDGAGMARPTTFAAFAQLNMPLGNPMLSDVQAEDVGLFVNSQPRTTFAGTQQNIQ